ncbi:MAG: septal ring lytic transglycosylase RlpA family protein [Treponema sp.]
MKKYSILAALLCVFLVYTVTAEELLSPETYASYYGEAFDGRPTASGEIFDMNGYTAAHKTLPFGTLLEVTNLENGKKVVVRVNDRGPFVGNREIDVSKAAADSLGMLNRGIARVSIKVVSSLEHAALVATYEQRSHLEKLSPATPSKPVPVPVSSKPADHVIPADWEAVDSDLDAAGKNDSHADNRTAENVSVIESIPNENAVTSSDTVEPVYKPANLDETTGPLWRIQIGSFAREENALRLVVQLRKLGIEPAYERTNNSVRVVIPAISPEDVDAVKKALEKGRITDYVIRQERW